MPGAEPGRSATAHGLLGLLPHVIGKTGTRHRTNHRVGVERVAELPAICRFNKTVDEFLIDVTMHIYPFHPAAALSGIEERAIDQAFDRFVQLDIGADIGRVLAAKLKAQRGESARRSLFNATAAGHRAGKIDVVDLA